MAEHRDCNRVYHVCRCLLWINFFDLLTVNSFFHLLYMWFTELITAKKSEGEVLVFRRGHKPAQLKESKCDTETGFVPSSGPIAVTEKVDGSTSDEMSSAMQESTNVFHWR